MSFSNIKFLGFFSGEKDLFGIKKQVYAYPQHEPLYGTQLPFLLCSQDTNSCLYVRNLPKVYSEQICDLLTNSRPSAVREDAQNEVVAQGLTLHHISQILRGNIYSYNMKTDTASTCHTCCSLFSTVCRVHPSEPNLLNITPQKRTKKNMNTFFLENNILRSLHS